MAIHTDCRKKNKQVQESGSLRVNLMNTAIKKKLEDEESTRNNFSPTYFVLLNYISVCFSVCV